MKKNSVLWIAVLGFCVVGLTWPVLSAEPAFRTWSDSTGKFKIKAKLIALKGDVVTLQQEDGSEIEIALSKLSTADQKEAKKPIEDGSSPFESKSDPVRGAKKKGTAVGKSGEVSGRPGRRPVRRPAASEAPEGEVVEKVKSPIASVKPLKLPYPNATPWRLSVPTLPKEAEFSGTPKSAVLPAKLFFEHLERLVINVKAQKAVAGYINNDPSRDNRLGESRMVFADLSTGTAEDGGAIPGRFRPLALSDDSKSLLVHRYGEPHSCEIWTMNGAAVVSRLSWIPFEGEWGGGEIVWGEFVGTDKLVLASRGGNIGVWKVEGLEPLYYVTSSGDATPALSPDKKWLAFSDGNRLDVLDLEKKKIVASVGHGMGLRAPSLAFSPSGKQLCCMSGARVVIGDTASGKLLGNLEASQANNRAQFVVPSDGHILVKNEYLFNVPEKVELWKYAGAELVTCAGGWSFLAVNPTDQKQKGRLIAMKIPHAGLKELLSRAEKDSSVFALREGSVVKLDLSGLPDAAERAKVAAGLTSQLEKNKCKVGDDGTVTLVATITGPKETEVSYESAGTFKFQELRYTLQFVHKGVPIWHTSRRNVPSVIEQTETQTFEAALRAHEKADYNWYTNITLPKYLQNLGDATGENAKHQSGFGYGESEMTSAGMK